MTKKIFESFVDKVLDFPFWVKEVLFIKLREDFEAQSVSESDLHTPLEESYQLYTPLITLIGQAELEQRGNSEDEMVYRFLQGVAEGCSIAEITIKNFWTLADTARINIHSIQREYVSKPSSPKVLATALYACGRIKLGDYFRRIGRITVDDIDEALRRQKEMRAQGKNMQFADILVMMGLLTKEETNAIIYIKDECKKRFIFNANMLGKSTTTDTSHEQIRVNGEGADKSANLVLLRQEIFELRNKLSQIASIVKK